MKSFFNHLVTKCSGANCPIRGQCERFTSAKVRDMPNLLQPPFTITNGIFKCSLFWGEQQNSILHQLETIVGKRKPDAYCDGYCSKSTTCDRKDCSL